MRESNWVLHLTLLLLVALSFWRSPVPQRLPDQEYWGEYVPVEPGLGFVLNHDSQGYIDVARYPAKLLQQEVRQSRPLYALLGRPWATRWLPRCTRPSA